MRRRENSTFGENFAGTLKSADASLNVSVAAYDAAIVVVASDVAWSYVSAAGDSE